MFVIIIIIIIIILCLQNTAPGAVFLTAGLEGG